jgi:hypothetical protein
MYVCSLVHKGAEKTSKKLFRTETETKGTKGTCFFLFFFFGNFVKKVNWRSIIHPQEGQGFSFKDFVM